MRDILLSLQGRTKAVVSIHNNAQVWLSPYGYTTERPVDYAEMVRYGYNLISEKRSITADNSSEKNK
jgi:hypothetical protein